MTQQTAKKHETEIEFTTEQKRMQEELANTPSIPHGKELAKLSGKIEGSVFEKIHKTAKDPNISDSMKKLLKAVADNKFTSRGKFIPRFMNALEGGPKEKEYAEEVIREISDPSIGKLSKYRENKYIRKFAGLREEDQAEMTMRQTGSSAMAVAQTAETSERISKATEIKDENWIKVPFPREIAKQLDEAEFAKIELTKEDEALSKELTEKESRLKELQGQLGKTPEIEKLKKEIANILKRQFEIDDEIQKIIEENKGTREKFIDYLKTNLAQYREIKRFSEKTGFDMNTVRKLLAWAFKTEKGQKSLPATAGTIITEGGETIKKLTNVEIENIGFLRPEDEERSVKQEPESPGVLMVDYKYEGEKKLEASSTIFENEADAFEMHLDINTPEELNEKYRYELGGRDIRDCIGETFSGKRVVEMKEGETVYKHVVFKIEEVAEVNGKWSVKTDKAIVVTPEEWLSKSLNPDMRFPRIKRNFDLGAFGAMLRKSEFHRDIKDEEMQEVADMIFDEKRKQSESFIEGSPEAVKKKYVEMGGILNENIKIPKPGESTEVIFRVNEKEVRGGLTAFKNEKGETEYEIELYSTPISINWGKPRISSGKTTETEGGKPKITKKVSLNKRHLSQAINKGDIQNSTKTPASSTYPSQKVKGAQEEAEISPEEIPTKFSKESEVEDEVQTKKEEKIHYEALAYDDIHKVGGMGTVEKSYLKSLWADTRFLSVSSFWEMGKAMYEYYQRRFERRQKGNYSQVGAELPFFAPEMQRIQEATEHEQMNMFKEAFEDKGVFVIQGRLRKTSTRDEFKAAMLVLCEKGQMRWDDIDMWRNLNNFIDPALAVPIPSNGDPFSQISSTDSRTGFDFLKEAIDSMWGEGTYNEWYSKNKSTYSSSMKGFYEEGKELESLEGGHTTRLSVLLEKHKRGEFIDPHEYEGLIEQSISDGKSTLETKIFYMIEGVAAQNPHGQTILSFDRIAHLNSAMLAQFPPLEYLTASVLRPDGKSHRFTLDDYKRWASWFEEGDPMKTKPGKAVRDFMWKYMIPSDEMQNRVNKDLRNGDKLDHDDMFALLPPASEVVITDACRATGGNRKILTIEGYANVFPGFSQYIKSLTENDNKPKLVEAIKSYVRFEGVMMEKFDPQDKSMQRMDDSTLDSGTIVTPDKPPRLYINELNKVVQKVIAAYDDSELTRVAEIIFGEKIGDIAIPENKKKQDVLNYAYRQFGKIFKSVTDRDNGELMRSVISGENLTGM